MNKIVIRVVTLVLALAIIVNGSVSTFASRIGNSSNNSTNSNISEALKAKADKYVSISNGVFVLSSSAKNKLSTSEYSKVRNSIRLANKGIAELKNSNNYTVTYDSTNKKFEAKDRIQSRAISGTGWRLYTYWWGVRIYLASYLCVSPTIASVIPSNLVAATRSALSLGIVFYNYNIRTMIYEANVGRGVYIDVNWILYTNIYSA